MLVFSLVLARSTSLDTACSAQPLRGPETHWFLDAVNAADQAQEALRLIDPFPRYARSEFGRGSPILSLDESAKFPRSRRRSHRPPKPHEVASSPLRATMQAKRASGRDFGGFVRGPEVSNWVSDWVSDWGGERFAATHRGWRRNRPRCRRRLHPQPHPQPHPRDHQTDGRGRRTPGSRGGSPQG